MSRLNERQAYALNVISQGDNLAILGQAGTGKTEIIKEFIRLNDIEKKGRSVSVTASTGVAASRFQHGRTLHHLCGLLDGRFKTRVHSEEHTGQVKMSGVRTRLMRMLLGDHGWLFSPNSLRTKAWAVMLRFLQGKGPHSTFYFQPHLPRYQVPDLDQSLNKFLRVSKLVLPKEDFQTSELVVEDFRQNEGRTLQAYLQKKAATKSSWQADYFLSSKYLSSRKPLAVYSNVAYVANTIHPEASKRVDQLARTAANIFIFVNYERQIYTEKLPVQMIKGLVPLCMDGYKYLFNTTRIPGEKIDTLLNSPSQSNPYVTVIRKGHYFKLCVYAEDPSGEKTQLTCSEILHQLQRIVNETEGLEYGVGVAALTTQERTIWAKHRENLKQRNKDVLGTVEESMFVVCLDTDQDQTRIDFMKSVSTGDGRNRWFDKTLNLVTNADGECGINWEHSFYDGTIIMTLVEDLVRSEKRAYGSDGNLIDDNPTVTRHLTKPERLSWNLEDLEDAIAQAEQSFKTTIASIDFEIVRSAYASGFIKSQRMSPAAYIQMSMQLAYYRLHKEIPKAYFPGHSRLFRFGRTESIYTVTEPGIEWLKLMDDISVSKDRKLDLLRASIEEQKPHFIESTAGQGFDRHLVSLHCAAEELGMRPKLFEDKAYKLPLKLFTATTPANVDCGVVDGTFPPVVKDGYAIEYLVSGDDVLKYIVCCWNDSGLSCRKMAEAILTALKDMKDLFE